MSEQSAVEVIAEAIPHLDGCTDWTPEDDFFCWCKAYRHEAAEAVLAAIHAMTPEQMAEVIGGEVESDVRWLNDGPPVPADRVVGPWRELQP